MGDTQKLIKEQMKLPAGLRFAFVGDAENFEEMVNSMLVDLAHRLMEEGKDRSAALAEAGRTRLRPILMTTMALIAGTMPVAIGLNEASKVRSSMGIAIVGGIISSTLLSLIVIPAAFIYIDRFRVWVGKVFRQVSGASDLSTRPESGN